MTISKKIKVLAISLFILYGLIDIFYLRKPIFDSMNPEMVYKSTLKKDNLSVILIGGSNIEMGISAAQITKNGFVGLNLGISGGGNFEKYRTWLSKENFQTTYLIYSPAELWQTSPEENLQKKFLSNIEFILPVRSIASRFKQVFLEQILSISPAPLNFNQQGDFIDYQCFIPIKPHMIDVHRFTSENKLTIDLMVARVLILQKLFIGSKIYLKVPPIYSSITNMSIYEDLMKERIILGKSEGLNFITQEKIVLSDKSYFCDSFHANAIGREYFTNELLKSIYTF